MNNFKKIVAGLCAISCLAVLTACGNKTEEVLALIDKGEFSDALDLYEDEIEDSSKEREQRKEIKKGLEKRYDKILDMYANDEIKEKELEDFFELIDELKIDTDDDEYDKFYSAYIGLQYEKEYYKDGLEQLEDEHYSDAIYYFELIGEDSPLYKDAQAKLAEAQEGILEGALAEAQEYIDNEVFASALDTLEYYEDELAGNEKYEKMLATAKEGVIAEVKANVDEYFADYDYHNAYFYLRDQANYYSDIAEIQSMYGTVGEDYVNFILEAAKEKAAAEDYEAAIDIIEIALDEYDYYDDDLNAALDEYKSKTSAKNFEVSNVVSEVYIGMTSEIHIGMTSEEVFSVVGSDYKLSSSRENSQFGTTTEYDYFLNSIDKYDLSLPGYMFFEFDENDALVCYGYQIGVVLPEGTEDAIFPCTEAELDDGYEKILDILIAEYGEGGDNGLAGNYGVKGEHVWNTDFGDIWLAYGINMWGTEEPDTYEKGINQITFSCTKLAE